MPSMRSLEVFRGRGAVLRREVLIRVVLSRGHWFRLTTFCLLDLLRLGLLVVFVWFFCFITFWLLGIIVVILNLLRVIIDVVIMNFPVVLLLLIAALMLSFGLNFLILRLITWLV